MNKIVKVKGTFIISFTETVVNNIYVMQNNIGQYGYLPNENKPYSPIGGKKTLRLVESLLIFK